MNPYLWLPVGLGVMATLMRARLPHTRSTQTTTAMMMEAATAITAYLFYGASGLIVVLFILLTINVIHMKEE